MDAGERRALIAFYKATSGDSWNSKNGWCTNAPLGEWFGVVTNDQGSVVKLTLVCNNLEGVIPAEIGELKNLQVLELYRNTLNGAIPEEIGELKNLQVLNLYFNKLNGAIPAELGKLANLQKLHLGANQLSGVIPAEIGELKNLQVLSLSHNKLNGAIPKELGELKDLRKFYLNDNQLSGAIPAEMGKFKNLQELSLGSNQLSGAIPTDLGKLEDLQELYLHSNQLSGPIPKELGLLLELKAIWLNNNKLTGAIPKEFGELKDLQRLDLSNNQFSDFGGVDEAQKLLSKFERVNRFSVYTRGEQAIDLRGNPWIMPPESVVEKDLKAVRSYYADVRVAIDAGADVITRRLLKVVLVGSSSAGKTSLMNSIVKGEAFRTKGTPEEASTEGINVESHQLENTSVEFYDCAGQVDYGGMHQVFLTRRALFLLVWDIQRCSGLTNNDFDKEVHDIVMRWLYTLHLRAPGSTVILVANKCDTITGNDAVDTAQRVEDCVMSILKDWKERRGFGQGVTGQRVEINLLLGSSCVSCDNYSGIRDLGKRVLQQFVSSIQVPPAWELALKVFDALRGKRSPFDDVMNHLELPNTATNSGEVRSGSFITKNELFQLWQSVLEYVRNKVRGTSKEAVVYNSDFALEGAIWISEFAGQILLVEDGRGIFLDVVWLSDILTPILSHKLGKKPFPTAELGGMRDDLVEDKILRWKFARHLWSKVLTHSSVYSEEQLGHALYRVLMKLGVALPLGPAMNTAVEEGPLWPLGEVHQSLSQPPDMLVIMRMRETCGEDKQRLLNERTANALGPASEITLKWKFDAAGSPYGLVERIIASCHYVGVLERNLCWRYGALFRSGDFTRRFGQKVRLFTMVVRYDTNHDNHVLTAWMIGPLKNPKVLAALRYVASAVVLLSKEWPGVILKGSPVCPKHPRVSPIVYLATPDEANIGDRLIPELDTFARSNGCDCHLEVGEVLGLVVKELGLVVDLKKDPFEGLPDMGTSMCNDFLEMFVLWRPYAWRTAVGLWGLALVLFGEIASGVVEEKHALWQVCLAVMMLSLVGAVISSAVFYRDVRDRAAQRSVGQSAGDVEAVPLMAPSP